MKSVVFTCDICEKEMGEYDIQKISTRITPLYSCVTTAEVEKDICDKCIEKLGMQPTLLVSKSILGFNYRDSNNKVIESLVVKTLKEEISNEQKTSEEEK